MSPLEDLPDHESPHYGRLRKPSSEGDQRVDCGDCFHRLIEELWYHPMNQQTSILSQEILGIELVDSRVLLRRKRPPMSTEEKYKEESMT